MNYLKSKTELDQITAFLQDETGTVTISPAISKKLERIDFADNLLRRYNNSSKLVVPMLMKKFGISKQTAYVMVSEARTVFAAIGKVDKEYWRMFVAEKAAEMMMLAYKEKEYRAAASFQKNLIDATGLNRENAEMPNFNDMPRSQVVIVCDASLLGLPAVDNLDKLINELRAVKNRSQATDVDFEDLSK